MPRNKSNGECDILINDEDKWFLKNFPEGAGSYFIITRSFLVREESVFIIVRFAEESWEISKKIKFQGL